MNGHPYGYLGHYAHFYASQPDTVPSKAKNQYVNRSGRRERTSYNEIQLKFLESHFQRTQHPDVTLREAISAQIGVTEGKILIWFKNRRAKERQSKKHIPVSKTRPSSSPSTSLTEEESPPPPPEPHPTIKDDSISPVLPHTEFPSQAISSTYPVYPTASYPYTYPYNYPPPPYDWYNSYAQSYPTPSFPQPPFDPSRNNDSA
ncbi:hypothetical protein L596_016412 [Steinernema carpocapsae]|uniref:Homeobox domain-containing protein n=1 Tax=Steinernema carpocapsae TaxID=34508 RepID=A0A4U5NJ33_STECR|nr:hypothetical protein L596_016412 [Steinernema carpocapsae]